MNTELGTFRALNNKISDGIKTYTAEEYYENYKKGIETKIKIGTIPNEYKFPVGVQFELTYRCNHRCIHCYNSSGANHKDKEMSIDDWIDLAKRVGEIGVIQCIISGGEPTILGDDLFKIMDVLDSFGIEFVFITNGFILNGEMMKKLSRYRYSWFQVSIDGSRPELHNYVRGISSWKEAINATKLVRHYGIPLVISHAVVKRNINYLKEMIDLAYLLGAARIISGPFTYTGRAIDNVDKLELSDEEKIKVYNVLNSKRKEYAGRMEVTISAEEPLGLRLKQCDVNGALLIRPNGDVKIDCIAPFKIGNILDEDIYSIWDRIGRNVWKHPRVIEYVNSIKSSNDLKHVKPIINVDEDELIGGK